MTLTDAIAEAEIPADWLRKLSEKHLSDEEKAQIEAMGGWDKLMETLKKRLEEQKDRHQGGSKWIGTAGTSPFGAYGYNPEGVRIGQHESRHRRAVKVWDKREFKQSRRQRSSLGPGTSRSRMKRLRRNGPATARHEELDLDGTIRATAEHGYLDVQTRPERQERRQGAPLPRCGRLHGRPHVKVVEELFSAARDRVQAPRVLLLSQLPLRRRLARQPPPLDRTDRPPTTS